MYLSTYYLLALLGRRIARRLAAVLTLAAALLGLLLLMADEDPTADPMPIGTWLICKGAGLLLTLAAAAYAHRRAWIKA